MEPQKPYPFNRGDSFWESDLLWGPMSICGAKGSYSGSVDSFRRKSLGIPGARTSVTSMRVKKKTPLLATQTSQRVRLRFRHSHPPQRWPRRARLARLPSGVPGPHKWLVEFGPFQDEDFGVPCGFPFKAQKRGSLKKQTHAK